MISTEPPPRPPRCGARDTVRIGNQVEQHVECARQAGHGDDIRYVRQNMHWAVVLDSDDNAISHTWPVLT